MKHTILKSTIFFAIAMASVILFAACEKDSLSSSTATHPFGAGNGKFSIYTKTDLGQGAIACKIDGIAVGSITHYHPTFECGNVDINKVLGAGTHTYSATSTTGVTWGSTFVVTEDVCSSRYLVYTGGSGGNGGGGGGTGKGDVIFYTDDPSKLPITITFGSIIRKITQAFASKPSCGTAGCANFTLLEGSQYYEASYNTYNYPGSVDVVADKCNYVKIQ
jgi:hypothetical protein